MSALSEEESKMDDCECGGCGLLMVSESGRAIKNGEWLVNENATIRRCPCNGRSVTISPFAIKDGIDSKKERHVQFAIASGAHK